MAEGQGPLGAGAAHFKQLQSRPLLHSHTSPGLSPAGPVLGPPPPGRPHHPLPSRTSVFAGGSAAPGCRLPAQLSSPLLHGGPLWSWGASWHHVRFSASITGPCYALCAAGRAQDPVTAASRPRLPRDSRGCPSQRLFPGALGSLASSKAAADPAAARAASTGHTGPALARLFRAPSQAGPR